MPLDPVHLTAVLEDVRQHMAGRWPGFEEAYRRAATNRRLGESPPIMLAEAFLLAALHLPASRAATRREVALALASGLPTNDLGATQDAAMLLQEPHIGMARRRGRRENPEPPESPWIDIAKVRTALLAGAPNLSTARLDRALATVAERFHAAAVSWRTRELDAAVSLPEALQLTDRWLPGWTVGVRSTFLTNAGRPCPEPSRRLRTILRRLGWMESTPVTPIARDQRGTLDAEALRLCDQIGRLTGRTAGQVGILLDLLTGRHEPARQAGVPGPCVVRPHCSECPAQPGCLFARLNTQGVAAEEGNGNTPIRQRRSALPRDERRDLHERVLQQGASALDDADLLAVLLRRGVGSGSPRQLAEKLLADLGGLPGLDAARPSALHKMPGMLPGRVAELQAALELARRLHARPLERGQKLEQASDVVAAVQSRYRNLRQEVFLMVLLNTRNEVVDQIEVGRGTLSETLVHPRDVFAIAVAASAAAVIFVHNHPSGDPTPSGADREVTVRLREAGRLLGIRVLDHVIVGDGKYFSFDEDRIVKAPPLRRASE